VDGPGQTPPARNNDNHRKSGPGSTVNKRPDPKGCASLSELYVLSGLSRRPTDKYLMWEGGPGKAGVGVASSSVVRSRKLSPRGADHICFPAYLTKPCRACQAPSCIFSVWVSLGPPGVSHYSFVPGLMLLPMLLCHSTAEESCANGNTMNLPLIAWAITFNEATSNWVPPLLAVQ